MTERIPQSTAKVVVFKAYLASDHVTEATGKTIAITISKNGGAFGNPNAGATNATEISSGWYKVSLDTTDTATLGPLAIRGAVALIDDVGILHEVVSATSGGMTNLDAAVTTRMATYTQPTGFLAATFPTGTVANTTNITAGTITTVTTVTNQLTAAQIATGVWTDTTAGDFTTALSVGKSLMNGVTLGTGLTVNDITTKTGYSLSGTQTFNLTGSITGSLSGSVGSVTGAVGSVTGLTASNLDATISSRMATYTQPTGFLAATFPGTVASTTNITGGTITTVTTLTGLTASDVGAIKAKTDSLAFTVPGFADVNIQYVNDTAVTGNGSVSTPWGP